jgi:hypothetical protein
VRFPLQKTPHQIRLGVEKFFSESNAGSKAGRGHVISEIELKIWQKQSQLFADGLKWVNDVLIGFHFGMGYEIVRDFSGNMGFFLEPSDYQRVSDCVGFSLGLSHSGKKLRWQLGTDISWRNVPEEKNGILKGIVEERMFRLCGELHFCR